MVSDLETILDFYKDKTNYSIKNGVIPVMVDGGDLARSYQPPKQKAVKVVEPPKKVVKPKGRPKKNKSGNDEDLSYLPKYKSERREENTSMDLVATKCIRCSSPTTARKFELNNEFASVLCKNCLKRK